MTFNTPEEENEGTTMSDATINDLIKNASPQANEPTPLDLSQAKKVNSFSGMQFTMDSIAKYHLIADNFVELSLYQMNHDQKQSYIIFNNDIEASYSPYFKLLTLQDQDTLMMKTICQIYGNEQMDYVITATGVDQNTIELTTDYTYVYVHGIGEVDSTRVEVERFTLK